MTALLAVEFEPETSSTFALNALRRLGLVINSLDCSAKDAVANVEVVDTATLNAAVEAICKCTGVRMSAAFPYDA